MLPLLDSIVDGSRGGGGKEDAPFLLSMNTHFFGDDGSSSSFFIPAAALPVVLSTISIGCYDEVVSGAGHEKNAMRCVNRAG